MASEIRLTPDWVAAAVGVRGVVQPALTGADLLSAIAPGGAVSPRRGQAVRTGQAVGRGLRQERRPTQQAKATPKSASVAKES